MFGLVPRALHKALQRDYDKAFHLMASAQKRAETAERLVEEKDRAILQLQGLVAQYRDGHPDAPLSYQPATGDARLQQLLALSEKARGALDAERTELIRINVQLTHEVAELRGAAAPAEGSRS